MRTSSQALYRNGRAFSGILFLCAGIIKITHIPIFLSYMASGGLPFVKLLLALTILMEFGRGFMLVFQWKSIYAAVILALFTIPTTAIFMRSLECRRRQLLDPVNQFPEERSHVRRLADDSWDRTCKGACT